MSDHAVAASRCRSVLISGCLNETQMARLLGEIRDIGAAKAGGDKIVFVIESQGGAAVDVLNFIECVMGDESTRALVEKADVKIYEAFSGATILALTMGSRREMAAGARIGFHLPSLRLKFWQVDGNSRQIHPSVFRNCQTYEELLSKLMRENGLNTPEQTAQLYSTGWLYLGAEECLQRGLVHGLFGLAGHDAVLGSTGINTILISGPLTQERLNCVLEELVRVAAGKAENRDLVLLFNSSAGNSFATLRFLERILGDELLRPLIERARIKIYKAEANAALLAFSLGCERELSADAKISFEFGVRSVQMGNPEHFDQDGRMNAEYLEKWRKYQDAVVNLLKRLGIYAELGSTFWAHEGKLELSAQECLRLGLVSRLF